MRTTILPAVVAALLSVLVAAPASADFLDLHDATGDVRVVELDDNFDLTSKPSDTADGDIEFARFQHTPTQAVLYVRYRELYVPKQYAGLYYGIEGTNGVVREVALETRRGKPQGTLGMINDRGRKVRCGMSHRVNYVTNSVSIRIPRACLKKPKYLRLVNVSYNIRVNEERLALAYDDPTRTGGEIDKVAGKPTRWIGIA